MVPSPKCRIVQGNSDWYTYKEHNFAIYFCQTLAIIILFLSIGCSNLTLKKVQDSIATNPYSGISFNFSSLSERQANDKHVVANTCAVNSLFVVLKHWQIPISKNTLYNILSNPPPQKGYSIGALQKAAKKLDVDAFAVSSTIEELEYHTKKGRPCIIYYEIEPGVNHAIIVMGIKQSSTDLEYRELLIHDTNNSSTKWISEKTILHKWKVLDSPMLLIAKAEYPRSKKRFITTQESHSFPTMMVDKSFHKCITVSNNPSIISPILEYVLSLNREGNGVTRK